MNSKLTTAKIECFLLFLVLLFKLFVAIEIRVPINYTALTGDLEVHVQNLTFQDEPCFLQLLEWYTQGDSFTIISTAELLPDDASSADTENIYKAIFPCGLISQGGRYGMRIQFNLNTSINEVLRTIPDNVEKDNQKNYIVNLDVRWPPSILSIEPLEIETYPRSSVLASVTYPQSYCKPSINSLVPETWISLIYCGYSKMDCKLENVSYITQILYSEQIRGYPLLRYITLNCRLFGKAGYYTLFLTSGKHGTGTVIATLPASNILWVKRNDRFILNVHARSIFQCDAHGGGIAVFFQYPECIPSNDKIRLYGSFRADVMSLFSPVTLHYITEQKVTKGKYSLHFDCDLFSEKFVSYCFVYVNQAITGSVSNVQMECIPTFPISENDAGNWGNWSEWSACSSTCRGGTRTRYRFCDSPIPRYGAKYCEGHSVETEQCGNSTSWECTLHEVQINSDVLDSTIGVMADMETCQCGCNISMNAKNPQYALVASVRNCSHKVWWRIEAEPDHTIQLQVKHAKFPCTTQKLKIHDGEFVSANLLAQLTSNNNSKLKNVSVMSSTPVILLQYSLSKNLNSIACVGGFLCYFRQKASKVSSIGHTHAECMSAELPVDVVRIAVLLMMMIVVSLSLCIMIQYLNCYCKYKRTSSNDGLADNTSLESFFKQYDGTITRQKTSRSTLISEVISLQNLGDDDGPSIDDKWSVPVEKKRPELDSKKLSTPFSSLDGSVTKSVCSPITDCKIGGPKSLSMCAKGKLLSSISTDLSLNTNVVNSPKSSLRSFPSKRTKDIQNREQVVGSDFNLTVHDIDLEIDYYDYNVFNTNAVPGSYLGMDPAYCLWIPPFASGQWMDNSNDKKDMPSIGDNIKMKVLDGDWSSKESLYSEKFQTECLSKEKEKFKRYSDISTATCSSDHTIIPADITPDNNLIKKGALLPGSCLPIQQSYVIRDLEQGIHTPLLERSDMNYVDDDDDDDDVD